MMEEPRTTGTLNPPGGRASVLITVSTPGVDTPICRLGNSEEVIGNLTVRELIERVINPNSLFSVGVPMSQLQAESDTALAIGEMLSADCCEVIVCGTGPGGGQSVSLDGSAREVAREQTGTQGNRFLNVSLEVRSIADSVAPSGEDRRQMQDVSAVEIESDVPALADAAPESSGEPPTADAVAPDGAESASLMFDAEGDRAESEGVASPPIGATSPLIPESTSAPTEATGAPEDGLPEPTAAHEEVHEPVREAEGSGPSAEEMPAVPSAAPQEHTAGAIVTILAEKPTEQPAGRTKERKEYARKSDWLRAQFLPEVEALDFSGLFVGNLGLGIREEKGRKNVVLADPSRITEVLLRANGYRRSGDHPKALICYQELVDMDASNADFRFLLGKTLIELGQGEQAMEALLRAKELGHDGAEKELEALKRSGHRPKAALGFLRFWK